MPGGTDIFDDIIEKLEHNGDISDKEYRQFVIFALLELGRRTKLNREIMKRIENLEENSIMLIAKAHPKASMAIAAFLVAFTFIWIDHLKLWMWFFDVFGIPLP